MTYEKLRELFPRASEAFLRRNCSPVGEASSPEPQRPVQHEPVAAAPRKESDAASFRVRIKSRRCQLIDPDNLCPKYFIDALRYAEIIPNDRAQDIALEVSQEKVRTHEEEETLITVTPIL